MKDKPTARRPPAGLGIDVPTPRANRAAEPRPERSTSRLKGQNGHFTAAQNGPNTRFRQPLRMKPIVPDNAARLVSVSMPMKMMRPTVITARARAAEADVPVSPNKNTLSNGETTC